jgi:large conductance mechanosensitive channel
MILSIISEFRTFITKGNVIDLAVAVVIGVAFNAVVTALVTDLITPLIGIPGHVDFSAMTFTINGSTFMYGSFINSLISFLVIAFVVFLIMVKPAAKIEERRAAKAASSGPTTKTCPECLSTIPIKARRCAYCTSVQES